LWNFRAYLKNDKKALTKFLKSVNWPDEKDVQQAHQLVAQWEPVDVAGKRLYRVPFDPLA
jgi:phosphatidylinositol 3-kinase